MANERDETRAHEYTVTNFTADRSLSGTEATAANIAATLATLISDLIESGAISGSVSA